MDYIKGITVLAGVTVGSGSAGGTNLSDPIDLRDISRVGSFSLRYISNGASGAATAGTVGFTYLCSQSRDGSYIKPSGAGTIGTSAVTSGDTDIFSFSPVVTPFMKIRAIAGTSAPAVVTAELNVR